MKQFIETEYLFNRSNFIKIKGKNVSFNRN